MAKIKLTETQILAFDMILSMAIRSLTNVFQDIMNAKDQRDIDKIIQTEDARFKLAMDKIKKH